MGVVNVLFAEVTQAPGNLSLGVDATIKSHW